MIYILILFMSSPSGSTSVAVTFNNKAACEVAANHISSRSDTKEIRLIGGCFPKG